MEICCIYHYFCQTSTSVSVLVIYMCCFRHITRSSCDVGISVVSIETFEFEFEFRRARGHIMAVSVALFEDFGGLKAGI